MYYHGANVSFGTVHLRMVNIGPDVFPKRYRMHNKSATKTYKKGRKLESCLGTYVHLSDHHQILQATVPNFLVIN